MKKQRHRSIFYGRAYSWPTTNKLNNLLQVYRDLEGALKSLRASHGRAPAHGINVHLLIQRLGKSKLHIEKKLITSLKKEKSSIRKKLKNFVSIRKELKRLASTGSLASFGTAISRGLTSERNLPRHHS